MRRSDQSSLLKPLFFIPFAALLVLHPLLVHGISCGHDLSFHIQSWLDAATQLSHGQYPHWAFSPAWNAGEPRFLFYPPLSWLLGALLISIFPPNAAPVVFIYLCICLAGFAMYHLARHYVSPNAALLASAFYLANPYLLFCAFERTAFAELLAAAWIPLLLIAVLRDRPTTRGIAIPIALLWLTNAPAAVMGCYIFALLATLRLALSFFPNLAFLSEAQRSQSTPQLSDSSTSSVAYQPPGPSPLHLIRTYLSGTLLGLALPAFYIIPAAWQRHFVQIDMAIIPGMRVQDNFLFTHTADPNHNGVNHTASALALTILILTIITLVALFLIARKDQSSQPEAQPQRRDVPSPVFLALAITTLVIALLFTPLSLPLWMHLPDLQYLQFPWRFLTILAAVLAFSLALLFNRIPHKGTPILAAVLSLALTVVGYRLYSQYRDIPSLPASIAALYNTHHGAPPTDEYTPNAADNDILRTDNPGYWLASTPNAPAPDTIPTATELDPSLDTDDTPVSDAQTLSTPAPQHFTFHASRPGFLILNLRDYPNWYLGLIDECAVAPSHPAPIARPDGLIAIPFSCSADHTVDITWHDSRDQILGMSISAIALFLFFWNFNARPRH